MVRSASLPVQTQWLRPTPAAHARPSSELATAPDCDSSAKSPPGTRAESNERTLAAQKAAASFITPAVLGPQRATPDAPARAASESCRATPASPASAKPELNMTAAPTPAAAQSWTTPSTAVAGTTTQARSGTSGSEAMLGYAAYPATWSWLRLTTWVRPR